MNIEMLFEPLEDAFSGFFLYTAEDYTLSAFLHTESIVKWNHILEMTSGETVNGIDSGG